MQLRKGRKGLQAEEEKQTAKYTSASPVLGKQAEDGLGVIGWQEKASRIHKNDLCFV